MCGLLKGFAAALFGTERTVFRVQELRFRFRPFDRFGRPLHLIALDALAIYRFFGRVLPPAIKVTMKDLPSIRWEDATLGLVINATVKIEDSQVEVVCDSTLENFTEVYMRTFDMTRAAVDSFCFVHGFGLSVILDRYFTPDEALHNITICRSLPKNPRGLGTATDLALQKLPTKR